MSRVGGGVVGGSGGAAGSMCSDGAGVKSVGAAETTLGGEREGGGTEAPEGTVDWKGGGKDGGRGGCISEGGRIGVDG